MRKDNKSIKVIIFIIIICLCLYTFIPRSSFSIDDIEKRAVWVSYQDLSQLDYSSLSLFEEGFENICRNSLDNKCNTLIVHVRAFQDALYKTTQFPVSKVITKKTTEFDPLDVMIEITHKYNMKFEAWINPLRISFNQQTYKQFKNNSPISSWINTNHVIQYDDYHYILNPASQKARDYIVDGVKEIIENYQVDGIHFDDYFYVEGSYQKTTEKQRKEYINLLIKGIYKTIKDYDENIEFGISPQGNYENCLLGGADVDTWLANEGYVDYVMPQIYWTNEYYHKEKIKMFTNRVVLWERLKRHKNVKLYVGLALYQAGKELDNDKGWSQSSTNIDEQICILYNHQIKGYSLFHYQSLLEEDGQKEMKNFLLQH